jgi:hypothetical protein
MIKGAMTSAMCALLAIPVQADEDAQAAGGLYPNFESDPWFPHDLIRVPEHTPRGSAASVGGCGITELGDPPRSASVRWKWRWQPSAEGQSGDSESSAAGGIWLLESMKVELEYPGRTPTCDE